jgi:phenylpropionate dioxygenase-like ring-hydroxylating dioxygenase large terminal subunit
MLTLKGYWYIAAPASELGKLPIHRSVEGNPVVLYHDSQGRPQALLDRCAHRGMALSKGKVRGDCLQCPYHGWTYDGRGTLCDVPALEKGAKLPNAASMRAFPVVESDEHLWVWIGDGTPERGPERFAHHGEAGWGSFFMHTRFEAPVELCLENFLDVPHTIFVHPGKFRGEVQRPTRARVQRSRESVEARFLDEPELEGFGPRLFFPRGTAMKHTDRFLLPSTSRVDYSLGDDSHFIITSQCTQREEFAIDVTTAITWRLPLPVWMAKPFLRTYCRRVIQEDVDLLKIQGEQIRRLGRSFVDSDADLLGRHIRALRRSAAEGHEAPAELTQEVLLRI